MICPENIGSVCKFELCLKVGVLVSKVMHRNSPKYKKKMLNKMYAYK